MSVAEAAGPGVARGDAPLGYELRMASHALASALRGIPADAGRVEQLLRTVIDLGNRTLRSGGRLPARPFAYFGGGPPVGAGALLAEYADPGSTPYTDLVARLNELNEGLLVELDQLVTHGEAADRASIPAQRTAAWPGEVPVLLEPVDDWYIVARAGVAFRDRTTVATPGADRAVRAAWTALPAAVAGEVERGLEMACRLVSDIGRLQPPAVDAFIDVRGAQSPTVVAPRACAAAVALTYLAGQGGLDTPGERGVLVLAGCADDGSWTPYAEGGRVLPDTGEDGLDCLWRDAEGWRLRTGTETRSDPDPGLEGAARLLWGERWQDTRRKWARETLETFEWRLLHSTAGAAEEGPDSWMHEGGDRLVELRQAGVLAHRFLQLPTSRVIQSGTRNSGKSVCARQLVGKLEKAGWQTVAIAPQRRHLPTDGSLPTIVRAALIAAQAEGVGRPRLVVLEDLHALVDGNIGAALESLGELKVAVLAVTRYVDGAVSAWDTHGVMAYMTPVVPEEIPRIAARLVADHPDVYRTTDEAALSLAVEGSAGDLGVLTDLLRDGVTATPAGDTGRREAASRLVRELAERACAGLDAAARTAVGRLAAVSMLDEGVPVALLDAVPEATRTALGVVVHEQLARIPSGVRAEAVLERTSADGGEDLLTCLERYLLDMLAASDHERVRALLANCDAYQPELIAQLLDRTSLRRAVTSWAATAHPPTALRLLRLCGKHSESAWIADALPPVLSELPGTPELRVRDLTTALKTLWDRQYQLPATAVADLIAWIGKPDGGLDIVLARPSMLRERSRFVRALLQLSGNSTTPVTDVCGWLEARADAVVRGADPRRAEDLIAIRRMDDVIHRWAREARGADAGRDGLRPLERSTSPLLEQHPTRDTPLPAVLAWISLVVHFDGTARWDPLIKQYEQQIRAALHHADAIQISTALADLARNNRGLTNRLLNNLQLGRALATILKKSTPAEAAILIRTVRNIHGATIKSLLYRESPQGSPVADVQLARDLAVSIRRLKDGRGAGMLLSSVSRADDLYCDTRDGFGPVLAKELGADFARDLMAEERRPAVIYHFLKGLWEAGAEYRTELEEQALNLVVSSIQAQRGAARPWGPQLAMLLIEDDYFGQRFLMKLAERLDTGLLVQRMQNPSLDPQSMVHTHRLGLALNPRIGEEFAKKVDVDRAVRSPVQWSAGDVAQKLQVMATTLRAGGFVDATRTVLRNFSDEHPDWDWATKLREQRRVGAFTTALSQLRKFDPSEAATAANTLITPQGDQPSHITDLLLRSVIHPPLTNDLLSTVERCQRGLGKAELAALRDAREARWQVFTEIFKFEQDPITQGVVGRGLARLGMVPASEPKNWMRTLVLDRWASTLYMLASPRGITEVLTLAYIWERQWGEQLAETVDGNRLLKRLGLRMRPDLRELPNLVTALWLTGRRDLVDDIVRDLRGVRAEWVAESMGLQQAPRMLKSLRHAEQPTDFFLPGVGHVLERTLARPRVVDAEEHWSQIGWAAQALADCDGRQYVPDARPGLEPNAVAYPAAVAWGASWLASGDWAAETVGAALDVFERDGYAQWQPREACMALIAAARAGRVPVEGPLAEHWQMATDGGAELLTLLLREADRVPSIADHFRRADISRRMRALSGAPGVNIMPCHPELAASVARLCPRTATPGAMAGDLGY
ncbi:hypothetical protein RKD23_002020 [Streptomyces sp. SAI-170]|uniref:hypothetical protein n=1 Tax=Streptomyces sp. SAI-170 TaxID=3377729 RepID=UPI003C7A19CE